MHVRSTQMQIRTLSYEGKMGNSIHAGRREKVKPEQTLATVRAAGAFKARIKQSKRKTAAEQIEEILEWKFRRKNIGARKLDTVDELQEQITNDPEKEVLKFVHR